MLFLCCGLGDISIDVYYFYVLFFFSTQNSQTMVCLLFTVLGEFLHVVCLIQGRFYCSFFFFFLLFHVLVV